MAMAVGGPKSGPRCDINMTPMIDILLVLLIIFMVITPLTPHGLEALAPEPPDKKNQPPPDQDRTVVIVIDKDKSMHINNEDTDMDKLGPRSGADLQDSRRTRGVHQRRSRSGVPDRGSRHRRCQRRADGQGRSNDAQAGSGQLVLEFQN